MSRVLVTLSLLVSLVIAPSNAARPCGAFFASDSSQNLAIGAQRALMIVGADTIALHLQLTATTDGKPFSWIIPVPEGAGPPTVALGDERIFLALDLLTTPSVTITRAGGGGQSLCGDAESGGLQDLRGGGVQHFGGGELGPYQYDILAGSDEAALVGWLEAHDYLIPVGFSLAVTPYLDKSVFIAVRLTPAAAAEGLKTEPLVVSWPRAFEAGLGYGLGLSKLSSPTVAPLLLWVLADKRQRVLNYGSIEVATVAETMRDAFLDYAAAVTALTTEAGGRLVITEFAKNLRNMPPSQALADLGSLIQDDAFYLTRLYAEVPHDAIEDLVITFAANAPEVDPAVTIAHSQTTSGLMLAASLLVIMLRRRA